VYFEEERRRDRERERVRVKKSENEIGKNVDKINLCIIIR
jgi:hypothetical protein